MNDVDILLIIPPFHMRNGGGHFLPLGTGYIISSLINRNYTYHVINCTEMVTSLFDEDLDILREKVANELKKQNPLVIGIGPCVTTQIRALKVLCNVCSKVLPNIPVFAGGPFASINGQEKVFFDSIGIKYLIRGDGEEAVPNVVETIKAGEPIGNCANVSYLGRMILNVVNDIDSIPYPYRVYDENDSFSKRRKRNNSKQAAMIASRGCPYCCNYCVSGNMKKESGAFRKRSFSSIVDEMIHLRDSDGIRSIIFYDDLFFSNFSHINSDVEEFCSLINSKKVGMTWQIEMRPDYFVAMSDKSLNLLAVSGCDQINLGIEKMSETGLKFLGKSGNRNGLLEKMMIAKSLSIKLSATFILGGRDETRKDVLELIDYAKTLPLDFAHFNPLFVYPGTPLYKEVFSSEEAWAERVISDSLPWGEIVYENSHLKTKDLLELVDLAYSEFYKDTEYEKDVMIEDRFNLKR